MTRSPIVLDASVGVKWFLDEEGSEDARGLIEQHARDDVLLVVDSLFMYEVVSVLANKGGVEEGRRVWEDLQAVAPTVVQLGDDLIASALHQRELLGANMYDCFSAGLASMLDAPLYSSDRRAHGGYPNVRLIG
jgi:predicted nucleic acid-binding protein